jgi:methanethiol S-methyltransferase
MRGVFSALYSAIAYLLFFGTFLYAIGFVANAFVPKSIDSGVAGDPVTSVLINLALLSVFAVQHSVMARPAFKRAWTRIVPEEMERSTYVLAATLALALIMWQWRPLPQVLWAAPDILVPPLVLLSLLGWGMVLVSTFLISHFHLFGLSQGFARVLGLKAPIMRFETPLFYKHLRHPIYAGFILAFWSTPQMTLGHLLFAVGTTGYILVGIFFEERDLITQFGDRYRRYREEVGMLFPKLRKPRSQEQRAP